MKIHVFFNYLASLEFDLIVQLVVLLKPYHFSLPDQERMIEVFEKASEIHVYDTDSAQHTRQIAIVPFETDAKDGPPPITQH